MGRKRKTYASQRNWDHEPEEDQTESFEVGDLAEPRFDLTCTKLERGGVYLTTSNTPMCDETPLINGQAGICMYAGTCHIPRQADVKTGGHWTQHTYLDEVVELHHVFIFNGLRISIPLEFMLKIQ